MMHILNLAIRIESLYKNICLKNILGFLLILLIPNLIKKFTSFCQASQRQVVRKTKHTRQQVLQLKNTPVCLKTEQKIRRSLQYLETQKSLCSKTVLKDQPKYSHGKIRIKQISKGFHEVQIENRSCTQSTRKQKTSQNNLSFMQKLQRNYQQQLELEYSLKLNDILNQAIKITTLEQNQVSSSRRVKKVSGKKQQLTVVYVPQKEDFEYIFENNHKLDYQMGKCENKSSLIEILEFYVKIRREKLQIYQGNYYKLTKLCLKYDLIEWTAFFLREIYYKKIEISKEILDEFIKKNFMHKLQQQNEEAEQSYSYSQKRLNKHHLALTPSSEQHYFSDFENGLLPLMPAQPETQKKERRVSYDENSMLQYNNNFYKSFFREFETEFNLIKSNWNSPPEEELDSTFYLGKKLNINSEVYSPDLDDL